MLDTSNLNPMTLLIVLLLLLQVAMLMSIIALYRHTKRNQETGQASPAVAAPAAAAALQAAPVAGADTALVAAITGALSFYFAQEAPEGAAPQGFVVRRIRRVH